MRNFILFILCVIAVPAWAAPSLTDLDSWQLPEIEPLPVAPAKPVSKPKPAASPKAKEKKGKELKVQLTEDNSYAVASSTRDVSEIDIMNLTAQQLMSKFAGKGRFHILFNANISADIDTEIVSEDGTDYALSVFGDETTKYRVLLFKSGLEQPLIATADDLRGKLDMMTKYHLNLEVTEEEMKNSYPSATPRQITGKEDGKEYHAYQLEGPLFVVFQSGKFIKQFNNEQDFISYSNDLQAISPEQRMGISDPHDPRYGAPGFPNNPNFSERRPGSPEYYEGWDMASPGTEHKRLFSQIAKNYHPRAASTTKSTGKKKTDTKSTKGENTSSKKSTPKANTPKTKRRL